MDLYMKPTQENTYAANGKYDVWKDFYVMREWKYRCDRFKDIRKVLKQ